MERLKVELGERSYPIEIAAGLLQHAEVLTCILSGFSSCCPVFRLNT